MNWKKIMLAMVAVVGTLILFEALALLMLYRNVAGYHKYWQKRSQQPGDFVYVALGDSAAQGLGASHPEKGYVGLIAKRLFEETGKSIQIVNLSKSGAVISDAIRDQIPQLENIKPNLITIEIGANDVAKLEPTKFRADFTELANKLPKGTYVSNMPYFGSRASSRPKAFQATKIIEDVLKGYPDLKLVDLQTITQERDSLRGYAADYFHPNDRAYQNWTEVFWARISKDL